MTPEDLAAKHPNLFHLTEPDCIDGIREFGLQSTSDLLTRFGISGADRSRLEEERRPKSVQLVDVAGRMAILNDNSPLSTKKLDSCLDDGLTPADWLLSLNKRVFFWPNDKGLKALLGAARNKGKKKLLITLDTLTLAQAYCAAIELAPINSGSTIHQAARRGAKTFSPLTAQSYKVWQQLRGKKRDVIKEVTILGSISDLERFNPRYEVIDL
jgi:hypothetical protein